MNELNSALERFRKNVVMTLDELTLLGTWSAITVRRRLKGWKTHTSYNYNGRYYVLPDIPHFDASGLWSYKGIRFSKFGTLTNTVVELVCTSNAGMTASELSGLLGYEMHPVLSRLSQGGILKREVQRGRNVYFSSKEKRFELQTCERRQLESFPTSNLSGEAAIAFLVEKIKFPSVDITELLENLANRGFLIDFCEAENFLKLHGLQKKT